ncbi:MAG: NAD-dependent epimerase/dehydratase family protein [Melioribacteraceae bacterium]|nr:NAD-dependent epimerase/dehydratase family protein [Melioribacteraceae bacterium]
MRTKVVITGGAGFIGSHIAEHWISKGADVHIIDNLRSGHLKNIEINKDAHFHQNSITEKEVVRNILKDCDYIHHLAALISVPESVLNPYECVDINVTGLLNVLESAKETNVKKIVLSSSAAIYGDNPITPKTTDLYPAPKSPYGITKLDGEYYLAMYNEMYGLGAVSLRYFNVFGPRQDPKSQYAAAIPIFVSKAVKNEPIIVYGDGEQTRDFIYVKDVVKANVTAALSDKNGVFNVASGNKISINQLIELILNETGSSSKVEYQEERPGDIKHSLASINETSQQIGFKADYDLITGLKNTISYFIDLYKA